MNNYPNKISRVIGYFGKLTVKIHVVLKTEGKDYELFHSEFDFNEKVYLRLNSLVYVTLERKLESNVAWSKESTVMILQNNMHSFINGLQEIIDIIYEGKMFARKSNGEIVLYKDEALNNTVVIHLLHSNSNIKLVPSIVYDNNEISYEGAILYFNNYNNDVPLTIDEIESLKYMLEHIDLVTYSQMVTNYFISYYDINKNNPLKNKKTPYKNKSNVFFNDKKEKEEVVTNYAKPEKDIMSGLNEGE